MFKLDADPGGRSDPFMDAQQLLQEVLAGRAPPLRQLTVGEVHRMFELGVLRDGEAVELIHGVLVRKDRAATGDNTMIHGPRHAQAVMRLQRLDERFRSHGFHLRTQLPVTLSDTEEPEPDAVMVRGELGAYETRHPGGSDVAVVVEVADSSLAYDRTTKLQLYAAHGIPTYAILNLRDDVVELHARPDVASMRYLAREVLAVGDVWSIPIGADVITVEVASLVPPRP
ncbi:MAG: Uma2 family endonuclease [Myxococcota bacterium]